MKRRCYDREGNPNWKHGYRYTSTYYIWQAMKNRCYNVNFKQYKDYGGRGITVCERWMKFKNFLEDMGERPEEMSLDRIDNEKGYYKENCKWSTRKEQNRNSRKCKLNEKEVWLIKKLLKDGKGIVTQKNITKMFKVTIHVIKDISRNKTWKDVIYKGV